jgi:stage V sporulation protein G
MNITDVKIRKIFPDGKVRAVVSIIIDNDFAVHDLKIIEGVERLFVAMPNRRSEDGRFQDIVHPISTEARNRIETAILEKYEEAVLRAGEEAEDETGDEAGETEEESELIE